MTSREKNSPPRTGDPAGKRCPKCDSTSGTIYRRNPLDKRILEIFCKLCGKTWNVKKLEC